MCRLVRKKCKGEGGLVDATRQHTGLTDILGWVGKVSGIDNDVCASFSEGDAAKILSIARYWIGSGGNTLPRLESWQAMHPLPYREAITEDVYGKLFKDVGRNEEGVQRYFSARAAHLSQSPMLAFDSTLFRPTLKINRRHDRDSTKMATDSTPSSF